MQHLNLFGSYAKYMRVKKFYQILLALNSFPEGYFVSLWAVVYRMSEIGFGDPYGHWTYPGFRVQLSCQENKEMTKKYINKNRFDKLSRDQYITLGPGGWPDVLYQLNEEGRKFVKEYFNYTELEGESKEMFDVRSRYFYPEYEVGKNIIKNTFEDDKEALMNYSLYKLMETMILETARDSRKELPKALTEKEVLVVSDLLKLDVNFWDENFHFLPKWREAFFFVVDLVGKEVL